MSALCICYTVIQIRSNGSNGPEADMVTMGGKRAFADLNASPCHVQKQTLNQRYSAFWSESGKWTYSITAKRMISELVFK